MKDSPSTPIRSVAFVCTGNICRSPMAEAMLKSMLPPGAGIQVRSYGVAARNGNPATYEAAMVAAETGLDLREHRASLLTLEDVERTDLLLVMERYHGETILEMSADALAKVFLLGCFYPEAGSDGREIPDPYGEPPEMYRAVRDELSICVQGLMAALAPRLCPR